MPTSNSSHIGIAKSVCEIISGGVSNMPNTKQSTNTYGRFFARLSGSTTPIQESITTAMGISKLSQNAKNSLSTKSR